MRAKRFTPIAGSVNLRMPCEKKISPTARRMKKMLAGPRHGSNRNRKSELIVARERSELLGGLDHANLVHAAAGNIHAAIGSSDHVADNSAAGGNIGAGEGFG